MWRDKSEILERDERYRIIKQNDEELGIVRDLEIGDLYNDVACLVLPTCVPLEIASQFDVARNAYVYSFFEYELATLAEEHAFAVLEMAVKRRAKEDDNGTVPGRGLTKCLDYAISQGWLHQAELSYLGGNVEDSLVQELADARNALAHGDFHLSPQFALEILKLTHDILSKLFDTNR